MNSRRRGGGIDMGVGRGAGASASEAHETPLEPDGLLGGDGVRGGHVLMVCSSGGHLAQLMALQSWWSAKRTRWVTFPTSDAQSLLENEDVVPAHHPTTRNLPNLVRNTALAVRVLLADRPDAIVSTGAGVALPFFVMGRLLGVPTIYIEVIDRMDTATLTGRLCRPFATRVLVQWEEQRRLYRDAIVVGPLL